MTGAWVKNSGHVLAGNASTYEQDVVQEPNVIADPTGIAQLRMFYTGGWDPCAIHAAVSNNGGLNWTRVGSAPIIGQGAAGVAGNVAHTGLWEDPASPLTLHLSFAAPAIGPLRRVTTTDGGLTWGSPVTLLTAAGWERGEFGNSACVKRGDVWHLIYEAMNNSGFWEMGYATSTDGVSFTRQYGGQPLRSLQVGSGAMYGGPVLTLLADGTWELLYHAATVGNDFTKIYRALSDDLIHWERTPQTAIVDMTLAYEVDQVADPHVVTIDGTRHMFYEGFDNPNQIAKINRATSVPS